LQAWWAGILERWEDEWEGSSTADMALCSLAKAEDDLTWYLAHWEATLSRAATLQLASVVVWNADDLGRGQWTSGFWTDRLQQGHQVTDWLLTERRVARLNHAAVTLTAGTDRERLEEAAALLARAQVESE
jgi:hypothetical protein